MKRFLLAAAMVAATSLTASAQVQLTQIARVNVGTVAGFGNQLSSVAWNGSTLVVGGYRAGTDANTGMIAFNGIAASPVAYNYTGAGGSGGTLFGSLATASQRGFNQLALSADGTKVYAAWDNGVASGNSVQAWNLGATPTKQWFAGDAAPGAANAALRGSGIAIDTGFGGGPSTGNVTVNAITQGRQITFAGQNTNFTDVNGTRTFTPGQMIYNQSGYAAPGSNPAPVNSGGLIGYTATNPGAGTTYRGLAFDASGNRYMREQNRLVKEIRTSDNGYGANSLLFAPPQAEAVNTTLQNIAYASTTDFGNLLFFNNAPNNTTVTYADAAAFSLNSPIRAVDLNGVVQTLDFNFATFGTPGESSKYFSFSFDAGTQTLAVGEFGTGGVASRVSIFQVAVVPEVGTLSLLAAGFAALGAIVLKKRKTA